MVLQTAPHLSSYTAAGFWWYVLRVEKESRLRGRGIEEGTAAQIFPKAK